MTASLFKNLILWYMGVVAAAWGAIFVLFNYGFRFGMHAQERILGVVLLSIAAAIGLFFLFLLIGIGVWVYHDALNRGMEGWMWTLIAVFVPYFLGLIVYLVVRQPKQIGCPGCGAPQTTPGLYCGSCGRVLQVVCAGCQRPAQAGQSYCPSCGKQLAQ